MRKIYLVPMIKSIKTILVIQKKTKKIDQTEAKTYGSTINSVLCKTGLLVLRQKLDIFLW